MFLPVAVIIMRVMLFALLSHATQFILSVSKSRYANRLAISIRIMQSAAQCLGYERSDVSYVGLILFRAKEIRLICSISVWQCDVSCLRRPRYCNTV